METIYYLLMLVLVAIGSSITTMYLPRLKRVFKRVFKRNKLTLTQRVELLEKRVTLHERKDKVYLDKFDEMEALFARRENDRKTKVRKQVREYLEELQK